MTIVRFDEDEFYPFIFIIERPLPWDNQEFDLSDAAINYINQTNEQFSRLQNKLYELIDINEIRISEFEEFVRNELEKVE